MKKTNIRPLHDRLLVRRVAEERKTAGGIVIPDNAAEKTRPRRDSRRGQR